MDLRQKQGYTLAYDIWTPSSSRVTDTHKLLNKLDLKQKQGYTQAYDIGTPVVIMHIWSAHVSC